MRAFCASRARLQSSVASGWPRLVTIAGLTLIALGAPTTAAYATELVVRAAARVTTAAEPALLVQAGKVAASLYPGARGDLSLLVTNTTDRSLTTGAVTPVSTVVTESAGACGPENFSLAAHVPTSTQIPAGETRALVLSGAILMKPSAGDGCQGAAVRFTVTVAAS
jgi:hypothetical protein